MVKGKRLEENDEAQGHCAKLIYWRVGAVLEFAQRIDDENCEIV